MLIENVKTNETLWHYINGVIRLEGFNDLFKHVDTHFSNVQIDVNTEGEFVVTANLGNTNYVVRNINLMKAFEVYKLINITIMEKENDRRRK